MSDEAMEFNRADRSTLIKAQFLHPRYDRSAERDETRDSITKVAISQFGIDSIILKLT